MDANRPRTRQWRLLARGIPLAGLLVLSGCSSGIPREASPISLADVGATSEAVKGSPRLPVAADIPAAPENRPPIATVPLEEKNGVVERSLHFSDGDTTLSEESIKMLRQQAEYLKQNPNRFVVLRAYLDSLGSRSFSLAIVQKRLNVVTETLREQGIAKSRIRQVMLGQRGKKPGCESPSCQNRGQRIELLYK